MSRQGTTDAAAKSKVNPPAGGQKSRVSDKAEKVLHKLIKKITEDIENFRFNTAISAFMEFHNQIKSEPVGMEYIKTFLILLYPFAPHISEELNLAIGGRRSLQLEKWPQYDASAIADQTVEIVVQINGKVKGKINLPADSSEEAAKVEALKLEAVKNALVNDSIKRTVFVKNRLINLVV